ncbi:MAG TPA: hypothetical protein VJ743_15015 [Albitalea sp.]|nr:hypothetical protein [Albitalea sp.]
MSTIFPLPVHARTVGRGTASRRLAGAVGVAVLAAALLSVLYLTGAQGSASSLDRLPPPGATARVPDAPPPSTPAVTDDGPTAALSPGLDFDAMETEPDPSPRAIANYDH